MFVNIIWLIGFAAVAAALGWLVWRAWHASNPIVKWGGAAGSGFLTMMFALVTVLVLVGAFKTYLPRGNPVVGISIEGTPEQIARGAHLANNVCAACLHPQRRASPLRRHKTSWKMSQCPWAALLHPT